MKGQWERYAVLNLGLVIPESFVRAKVESKKKLRDVIFNDAPIFTRSPPSTLIERLYHCIERGKVIASSSRSPERAR
jgi:hypothetical protein